jgi:hypothetical protein
MHKMLHEFQYRYQTIDFLINQTIEWRFQAILVKETRK